MVHMVCTLMVMSRVITVLLVLVPAGGALRGPISATICTSFTRMVTSTATTTMWIGIPAGDEYPNVKYKNRSPFVGYNNGARIIDPDGDVADYGNWGVMNSCGQRLLQQLGINDSWRILSGRIFQYWFSRALCRQ